MFEALSDRLGTVFDRLKGRGALNEADITAAMREVRVALLEADVALDVVKSFIDRIRDCLLYTSPSPRDATLSRMPSSA